MSAPTRRNDTGRAVWYRRGRVPRPPEFGNLYGVGRETRPLRGVVIVAGPPGGRGMTVTAAFEALHILTDQSRRGAQ